MLVSSLKVKIHIKMLQRQSLVLWKKTAGLLLCLTYSIWETFKNVVFDSGLCVLKGIAELRKKGVFSATLIRKRRYWPKFIDGEGIKKSFEDKEVGAVDAMKEKPDNVNIKVH